MTHLIAYGWPSPLQMLLLLGIGLLIFGKRLPEVGRSIGKTIVEFKKGMREVSSELEQLDDEPVSHPRKIEERRQPRFDPYTGKPLVAESREHEEEQTPSGT